MRDINEISHQIASQTKNQGEMLVRTDMAMDSTVKNADDAHKEIQTAQKY